jgi:plastocyanin
VRDFAFSSERIRVARGTRLRWKFEDTTLHNITVANGPRGFSSPNLGGGRSYRAKLDTSGTYRLFCTIHPTVMTQEIKVGRRR